MLLCVHSELRSSMWLCSFVCIPCSCSTVLISLHHLFCVFSHVVPIHTCLPPFVRKKWPAWYDRGMKQVRVPGLGHNTNLGLFFFFFIASQLCIIQYFISFLLWREPSKKKRYWIKSIWMSCSSLAFHYFLQLIDLVWQAIDYIMVYSPSRQG